MEEIEKERDPHKAVDFIRDNAELYAKAKAERIYTEEFRKSLKAILMKKSGENAVNAQEREAYAHPEYRALLDGLKDAVIIEETLRWKMIAAEARIEVIRTQEATKRMEYKATL
jgi:hypothetical protein